MKTHTTKPQPQGWTDEQVNQFIGDYLFPAMLIVVTVLACKLISR